MQYMGLSQYITSNGRGNTIFHDTSEHVISVTDLTDEELAVRQEWYNLMQENQANNIKIEPEI